MILDAQNALATSQALTATAVGENVIDLSLDRSIGNGEPLGVVFVVEVAADQTTGDEDYTFQIEYASSAAQDADQKTVASVAFESGTPTAPAQNADLLVAGYQFVLAVPPASLSVSERYFGIRSVLAGTSPTVTISAYLQPMSQIDSQITHYASGYTVS